MSSVLRVLVVGERALEASALASALASFDLDATSAAGEAAARAAAAGATFDAIVLNKLKAPQSKLSSLAAELKAAADPRLLVAVAVGDDLDPTHPPRAVTRSRAIPRRV